MEEEKKTKKLKLISIICIVIALLMIGTGVFILYDNNSSKEEGKKDNPDKEDVVKEEITPLMYEITKEGSDNKIYLFGSMHAVKKDEFNYPKYLLDAYEESEYLAVECDMPDNINNQEIFVYNDGTTIKDHISEETYDKLIEFLKLRLMYSEEIEQFKAFYFESLFSSLIDLQTGLDPKSGVDLYFINKAKEDGKTVLEVESYEFQINLLNSLSENLYEKILISYLDDFETQVKDAEELYRIWKKGDPSELSALLEDDGDDSIESEEDVQLMEEYNKVMFTDRNLGMKNKLEEYFENNQKVLFMVGAAHLIGNEGIVELLIQDGYTVTQINK